MRRPVALLFVLAVFAGCDRSPPPVPRVPVASVVGSGTITGRVLFTGPKPSPAVIRNQPCCPGAPATLLDEKAIVNANSTLANVFVYLEDGPKTEGSALPAAILDQKFCQYVPHVVGVVVGQPLKVHSSDPTVHNVNIRPAAEPAVNLWMNGQNQSETRSFTQPGFAFSKCDVHTWMNAWVGVFDNPFFAVTNDTGTFEIKNVPDGTYSLVAWHETYGKLPSQRVTVKAGTPFSTDFTYGPPTP